MQCADAVYSFRRDFTSIDDSLPDSTISTGYDYIGCDLFAFRVWWWGDYRENFPDMLLGRETWDCVLRLMMDSCNNGIRPSIPDLIYHEVHPSLWTDSKYRYKIGSQIHNLTLAKKWLTSNNIDPLRFGIK
jgi:hypothetical protein